jgi:hypothetical protein
MNTQQKCDELFEQFQALDKDQVQMAMARLFGHLDNRRKSRFGEQLFECLNQVITAASNRP